MLTTTHQKNNWAIEVEALLYTSSLSIISFISIIYLLVRKSFSSQKVCTSTTDTLCWLTENISTAWPGHGGMNFWPCSYRADTQIASGHHGASVISNLLYSTKTIHNFLRTQNPRVCVCVQTVMWTITEAVACPEMTHTVCIQVEFRSTSMG